MKRRQVLLAMMAVSLFVLMARCSVSHPAMRGSVVAVVENEAHICIGEHDGLNVGDTLAVYRTSQVGRSNLPFGPYRDAGEIQRSYQYEKISVGKVKVTRIFDEHFAAVETVSGEIDFPDIVEKAR